MTIRDTFNSLAARRETALIPYVTAGFPTLDESLENLQTIAGAGADLMEIGIPFSDPVADGPTIQHAAHTALEQGVRLTDILSALESVRLSLPLIAMSYLNPLLAYGPNLIADLGKAGISGLIVPDLPVEEADGWLDACRSGGIDLIFLAAPTSTPQRLRAIAEKSDAFIYYVSVTGTTGARSTLPPGLIDALASLKKITDKPVAAGFGISTPDQVRALHGRADGVVVGSRVIEAIRRGEDLEKLIRDLKNATKEQHSC